MSFEGRITTDTQFAKGVAPLSMLNMAPRGSVLRNTEWAYSLVIYTGADTKIIRNLKPSVLKISTLDHALNRVVLLAFAFNLVILGASVILEYVNYASSLAKEQANKTAGISVYVVEWYIGPKTTDSSFVQ